MEVKGRKAVWTHRRMNKAGIVGVGDSYYYGEKSRTEIKSEIGKEHPLIELQMPKGILENVGGLVKSQQSNSDVF